MLSIRDERVRTLAQDLMQKTGAPTITAAIRQALENEISRTEGQQPSLRERVDAMRREILGSAASRKPDPDAKDSRDDLWDR